MKRIAVARSIAVAMFIGWATPPKINLGAA
jgi:hypothetical protein